MKTQIITVIILSILIATLMIYLIDNYLSKNISEDKLPRIGYFLLLINLILIYGIYVTRNYIDIIWIRQCIVIILNSIAAYLAINKDKNTWYVIKAQIMISSMLSIAKLVYVYQYNDLYINEFSSSIIKQMEQINKDNIDNNKVK